MDKALKRRKLASWRLVFDGEYLISNFLSNIKKISF